RIAEYEPSSSDASSQKRQGKSISAKNNPNEDKDAGYNAINYAFVLDLMAFVRSNLMAKLPNAQGESAATWRGIAQSVRKEIIDYIPKLKQAVEAYGLKHGTSKIKVEHWIYPTLGEAYFGLEEYENAVKNYRIYAEGSPNPHEPSKRDKPRNWEIKTTARQMLAYSEFFIAQKKYEFIWAVEQNERDKITASIQRCEEATRACFAALYNTDAKYLPPNTIRGKVGLGLSGGGFRAALFHIGVLAALAERDVLRHVEVLSCVSGGSIAGAYYYLLLKKRLEEKQDAAPSEEGKLNDHTLEPSDYIAIVQEMEKNFLKGVQTNLRMSVLKNPWHNFKIFLDNTYSRSNRLAELYESELFKKITTKGDTAENDPMLMNNLLIYPKSGDTDEAKHEFKPKEDNWKRHHKVPILILNATSLNTGHNWQFTASWMGEPPANIRPDIDTKPRLRRMYYNEAPPPYRNNVRLGTAVGASSCVPALFTPIHFPDLYENQDLHLVDGGVHDNQGVASLLEQECKILIVSDASGQLSSEKISSDDMIGSFWRSDGILQERVRENQFLDLRERRASGQVSALSIVHLKKDLQANPIKWKYCQDPTRQQWLAAHDGVNISRTTYSILQPIQSALAEIRTDLDAFNDAEAYALMYSGYQQTLLDFEVQKLEEIFDQKNAPKRHEKSKEKETSPESDNRWKFMSIKPYMTIPEKSRWLLPRLQLGKKQVFRSLAINVWLRIFLTLTVMVLVLGICYGFYHYWKTTLLVVGVSSIGTLLIFKVLGHIGGPLISKLLGWKTFVVEVATAFVLAFAVQLYLWILAPNYLRYGRIPELEKEGPFESVKRWYHRWVR
ncbi:MAG TPA: patatin-like phospholipase family protein, partial [Saprospiraceae bacterium]|nr:patatin-like phospholipase family protein [Saprospiraceae bacterium]